MVKFLVTSKFLVVCYWRLEFSVVVVDYLWTVIELSYNMTTANSNLSILVSSGAVPSLGPISVERKGYWV